MEFLIIAALIASNGVLAMSEIALVSLRKSSLEAEAKQGNLRAIRAITLAGNPDRFFSTVQIGITLIGILTGIYSGDALSGDFAKILVTCGISENIAFILAQAIIVVIATFLTLIFGELVPKRIGFAAPERIAKLIATPMILLSKITAPFVYILEKSTGTILKLMGIADIKSRVTEREIKSLIKEGEESGEVQQIERRIVERVFSLGDRYVEAIMTPRNEIVRIPINASREDVLKIVRESPHSVYPIAGENLDDIRGLAHMEDLCAEICDVNFAVSDAMNKVHFFKDDTKIYHALEQMRQSRFKDAIVCNEFGVTLGIITQNDLIDAIFGDMPEKGETSLITQVGENSFIVDGQCPLHDFQIFFNIEETPENYHTAGGLVLDKLQRIPTEGDSIVWESLKIKVAKMDSARIDKILVELKKHD